MPEVLYCFGKWITTKDGILCSYIDFKTILLIRVMYGKQQHAVLFVVIYAFGLNSCTYTRILEVS